MVPLSGNRSRKKKKAPSLGPATVRSRYVLNPGRRLVSPDLPDVSSLIPR
ncbi:hypothetical protein SAMN05216570_2646 [Dyella sp. OK004]|nr:hypothetical protein SAMN05216570_2646 [Dyella sp. OK004]